MSKPKEKVEAIVKPADQLEVRRFFVANRCKNHFEKVAKELVGAVLLRVKKDGTLYYTFDETDHASAPEVITAGSPFKATLGGKTKRQFVRPNEIVGEKLTAKQLAAVTKFDGALVDAALMAGIISESQANAIELSGFVSEYPAIGVVK